MYESWNPNKGKLQVFEGGHDDKYIQEVTAKLLEKTKAANSKY